MAIIAFFDFDGTITLKDSLVDFIQYALGKPRYYLGLLINSPILIAYKLKLVPNYIAKEKLFMYYFKGWDINKFQELADRYSIERIAMITRPKAMERIIWHQQQGHKVVVVSASMENWLREWCTWNNIELIATKLESHNGKITGKFASKNCYSTEKVNRINEKYNIHEFSKIYAYGDSSGDIEMLNIADEKYYKYF